MRRTPSFVVFCAALLFVAACRDNGPTGAAGTTPRGAKVRKADASLGTCTTVSNLTSLINTVFGAGSPNAQSALGKLSNLDKQVKSGSTADAQAQANNLISFIQLKAGQGGLPGTTSQINLLIMSIQCYAGLIDDSFLVFPSDAPQTLVNSTGKSTIDLPSNPVTEPTLVTINVLPPGSPSPLYTNLDQYPAYVVITTSSPLAPNKTAVVAVCTAPGIDETIRARLVLGHQKTPGPTGIFEIPPPGTPQALDCNPVGNSSQSRAPAWLKRLASYVTPKVLYAKQEAFSRGVGATVTEFSPFGPVDPELQERAGVGSTVTEFNRVPTKTDKSLPTTSEPKSDSTKQATEGATLSRTPTRTAPRAPTSGASFTVDANGQCTAVQEAVIGTPVDAACRPYVVINTAGTPQNLPTPIPGVTVTWTATAGGQVAPQLSGGACGTFGSTVTTTTDANGRVSMCWTLGNTPGANTLTATPSATGLTPGITFEHESITFTANANKITPVAGAAGGTFEYDGLGHAGSGTCSVGPAAVLTYSGVAVPTNVGDYTLTATCGGTGIYNTSTATATISITPAPTTASVDCPTSVPFTGTARTPCTGKVTGPGLDQALTPSYSNNIDAGTATASVNYPAGGNYQTSSASKNFQITAGNTVTSVLCPATAQTFTGGQLTPCTATVSFGGNVILSPTPTYTNNVNVGTATASVNYAGGGNYNSSSGSSTFQIARAATTATVNCPTSVVYTGSPVAPCTGNVTGPVLNISVTPTYTNNVVGTATATVTYPTGGNYLGSTASKTFQIGYVQSGCFSSPVYSVMPQTKSFQQKGSNLPVKCTLQSASGAGVSSASGNLVVTDLGTNGVAGSAPACQATSAPFYPVAFSGNNVFRVSGSGNYAYGMDTSPAAFITGHFYCATASWNDGSTTKGYFFIK